MYYGVFSVQQCAKNTSIQPREAPMIPSTGGWLRSSLYIGSTSKATREVRNKT